MRAKFSPACSAFKITDVLIAEKKVLLDKAVHFRFKSFQTHLYLNLGSHEVYKILYHDLFINKTWQLSLVKYSNPAQDKDVILYEEGKSARIV